MKHLVLIDLQNDFVTGVFKNKEAQKIIPKVTKFLQALSNTTSDVNIYITVDTHTDENTVETALLPNHCVKNTDGCSIVSEIMQEIGLLPNVWEFEKNTFGSIKLAKQLSNISADDELYIAGLCTDICVISNALMIRAFNPYIKINVLSDLCAGTTPENHQKALDIMKINLIDIRTSEEII